MLVTISDTEERKSTIDLSKVVYIGLYRYDLKTRSSKKATPTREKSDELKGIEFVIPGLERPLFVKISEDTKLYSMYDKVMKLWRDSVNDSQDVINLAELDNLVQPAAS